MAGYSPEALSVAAGDVRLFAVGGGVPDIETSLFLSGGTCSGKASDGAPGYVDGARVPVPDWRLPSPQEHAALWSQTPPDTYRCIGLTRIFSSTMARLYDSQDEIFLRPDDLATFDHPLMPMLLAAIAKSGIHVSRTRSARKGRDLPGRLTMTMAVDQDARVGLHFDRWDRLALGEFENSTNRITINLGPTDRYFLCVNQTPDNMLVLMQKAGMDPPRELDALGKAFMAAFPDYPVIRLRLRPGEAYIAPTENILHDGSSEGVANINHYLSIRGRLNFA